MGRFAGGRAKESSEAAFGWPKGTQQEPNRSHEEAKRSPRGAQEEAKKRQRGAHEEPSGGQEEPKRNPREGLWSPEAENTGPKARPAKTYIKNESRSVPGEPKRSQEDAKRAQQEPKRSQEEAKRTCAKPTFSGMGCRCVNCHDFGALGEGWEKFKMVQRLEGGLGRVRRQLSGGREEPKRSPRRVQEDPRGPKRSPRGKREHKKT